MLKKCLVAGSLVVTSLFGLSSIQAAEPVDITVGYQPYDTISYAAAVIRDQELWKEYLPAGSKVTFEAALQGSIIVNGMLADKQQIGYLGDMPAVVSTTKTNVAHIKLVANLGISDGQRCNVVMVRADAPDFNSPEEAFKWLDGKVLATPKGSCADRFLRVVVKETGTHPKEVLNQSLEVIATNFRVNKIDAAVLWEPTVSRIGNLAGEGGAKIVATGYNLSIPDAGFLAMRADFIEKHPEAAKGWIRTELAAQKFILDPKNWETVARIVSSQANGITPTMAWFSIFGKVPATSGGAPERDVKPFIFTPKVHKLINSTYDFLYNAKVINVDKAPEGAIDDSIARQVMKEQNESNPLGVIIPKDVSQAPK